MNKKHTKRVRIMGMSAKQAYDFIVKYNCNDVVEFCEMRSRKEGVEMTIEQASKLWDAAVLTQYKVLQ